MGNTPNIRFKGFTDDWEQRKFSDLYEKNTEKNSELIGYDKTISIATMTYKDEGNGASDESLKTYKVLRPGDLAFEGHTNKEFRYGRFVANDIGIGIMSPRFSTLRPIKEMSISFWKYYIHYEPIMRKILVNSTKAGTMMNELVISEFLNQQILVPLEDEQKEIGQFLDSIEHLITLHQRKCDEMKKIKKFMLQKMFPKNGQKNPEIRFDGFTDDWEQRKFSDIASRESVSRESSYDLPSVEYEDVIAEEGRLNKDISLKENIKKGIVFDGSQVLYGKLRPYLHNWLNPDFSGVAVGDWWVLKPNNADKSFIYRLIQTQRFDDIANQSAGSKMPRADWNLVSNTEFAVPVSLEEQEKIGEYFSSLDHLITLHQRKVETLKNLKKYMLQNMFV